MGTSAPPRTRRWRVLPFELDEPAALLDRGAALLDALASDPRRTLRWYRSTSPAIVVGRGQRLDAARPGGPLLVARHSGGGAVLMDEGLLSLDVLLPAGDPLLGGDVGAVFGRVGAAWAAALTALGAPGVSVYDGPSTARRLGDERQRLLASVCYATLGRGEVLAGGRKLVGLAQRRRRPGALVQCGLLRRWRPGALLAALGACPEDAEVASHAVGLDDLVDPPPADGTVQAAVEAAMRAMGTQEPT